MTPLTEFGHGFTWGIVAGAMLMLFVGIAVVQMFLAVVYVEERDDP